MKIVVPRPALQPAVDPLRSRPAFYARTGTTARDLLALLHLPYTAWHLSYVAFGAVLAPDFHIARLAAVLVAFAAGTGIAAHALDEWRSRPLGTSLPAAALLALAAVGFAIGVAVAVVGAVTLSPWTLAWAAAGVLLAAAYTLELHPRLHTDLAFALAWGGFPVLVAYWAQTERLALPALLVALAAVAISLAQRALSTPARHLRRRSTAASALIESSEGPALWPRERLLATWERPLALLSVANLLLAIGLVAARL